MNILGYSWLFLFTFASTKSQHQITSKVCVWRFTFCDDHVTLIKMTGFCRKVEKKEAICIIFTATS